MKRFLATFVWTLILFYIFLFFGGALIFENIWALIIFIAFFIAIIITAFINQEVRVEELEERIKSLESQIQPKER